MARCLGAGEGERRAIARSRAEGILVGYVVCGHQHLHVVDERLGIGTEPQSERRGHGHLQVRVSGHQVVLVFLAQLYQAVEQLLDGHTDIQQLVAHEQLEVDEHLIVARAARVNLLADVAELLGEHELDLRVHVLDTLLDVECHVLDGLLYLGQPLEQQVKLLLGQQADALEHLYVGHGTLDVIARKAQVQLAVIAHGEPLYHFVGLEALAP